MFSSKKRKAALCALGQKVPLRKLPHVQPIFLLQMLIGLSQVLNGGAAQPEALARALIFDGQRRLHRLREAAPHLDLSLEHLLNMICPNGATDEDLSDEESAFQAMLEMCLGLMLRWLSKPDESYPPVSPAAIKRFLSSHVLLYPRSLSPSLLFRARSSLIP